MLKILNKYEQAYEQIKNFIQDEDNAEVWTKSYLLSLDEDLEVLRKLVIETTNPTLEEVKKEWEKLGYEWEEDEFYITLKPLNSGCWLSIAKKRQNYLSSNGCISFEIHDLITKTIKALEYFNE